MKWLVKSCVSFMLCCLLFVLLCSQHAPQPDNPRQTLQGLQSQAEKKLDGLNSSIMTMREYSSELEKSVADLNLSNDDLRRNLTRRQQALTTLEQLYDGCLKSLTDYATSLKESEMKLAEEKRTNTILFWIIIGKMAVTLLRIIAGLKWPVINKFIPWWLDVIL